MSFQLCGKCKGLWTFFGTGVKPEVCPKCAMDEKTEDVDNIPKEAYSKTRIATI